MQCLVVDVECFDDNIVKELAIASAYFCLGFSFAPNEPLTALPLTKQKTNNWLTRNLHGIVWESGVLPCDSIYTIANIFDNPYNKVYVKGAQKINILKDYFPNVEFVNLELLSCPKYSELVQFPRFMEIKCSSYPETHNSQTYGGHCAQRKASIYCQWLLMSLSFKASF